MPMDRRRYPPDWDDIARAIKDAADWNCQECGRPCRRPGESVEDFTHRLSAIDPLESIWMPDLWEEFYDLETGEWGSIPRAQRFCLTVAHLNHRPEDCRPENLRALCAPCHCRYDGKAMALKRRLKLEYQGQLTLNL